MNHEQKRTSDGRYTFQRHEETALELDAPVQDDHPCAQSHDERLVASDASGETYECSRCGVRTEVDSW